MRYYPICIDLFEKKVLVVGAGCVAERKIKMLMGSQARIKVVAPQATRAIIRWAQKKRIVLKKRKYKTSDIKGMTLVIAAASDKTVNARVSRDAKRDRVLVNIVDQPRLSNFISPALFHPPKAIVAVSTNGKNPRLSRDLKNFLKRHWKDFLAYRKRCGK